MAYQKCATGSISGALGQPYPENEAQAEVIAIVLKNHPEATKFEFTEWRKSTQIHHFVAYLYTLHYS